MSDLEEACTRKDVNPGLQCIIRAFVQPCQKYIDGKRTSRSSEKVDDLLFVMWNKSSEDAVTVDGYWPFRYRFVSFKKLCQSLVIV